MGATIIDVNIPILESAMTATMTILAVDISSFHQKWLRDKADRYNRFTRNMLEMGELILGTDYLRALQIRRRLKHAMRDMFEANQLDALVAPTSPVAAFPREELGPLPLSEEGETPLLPMLHHATPFNLTGQPALSVPCGFNRDGLPIGLQFIGRPLKESMIFRIAHTYESQTDWHHQSPPI
jgi:aspartyl-tRNA(Asn)/glutamyl-tRNA(Gln) amidotransferase subunit A